MSRLTTLHPQCRFLTACMLVISLFCSFQVQAQPDFSGIWSGAMTTQENLYWGPEDYLCFPGCPKLLHTYLGDLLADSANDERPTNALVEEAFGVVIEDRMERSTAEGKRRIAESTSLENLDMAKFCEPYGFVRETLNALPIAISEKDGHIHIRYEEFNMERMIYMDGRKHPDNTDSSLLGFSTGHYEGNALVVETTGISSDYFISLSSPTIHYGSYADGSTAIERYRILDNPRRLVVDLTMHDPVTLNEPYTWTKTWLYTPEVEILQDSCEDVPGQME